MRRRVFLAALVVAAAPAARAQGPIDQRLSRELDSQTYGAVVEVIGQARAKSLPVDPIVDKALEGAAKRASSDRIRVAVAALADRMVVARDALSPPSPSEAEISAGAGALARGVPKATLRTVRMASGSRSVAVALGVLTELVARGVSVPRASEQVVALVKRGATSQQLAALSEEVRQDIAVGIDAGAALDVRTRGLLPLLPGASNAGAATASTPTILPRKP